MHVRLKSEREVRINSISTRTFPAGWSGEVDADVAKQMKLAKDEILPEPPQPGQQFTADQAATLRAAADEINAAVDGQAAPAADAKAKGKGGKGRAAGSRNASRAAE